MNEQQFRDWLKERGCDEETVGAIVRTSNTIKKLYADQVKIGAAIDHEWWLAEVIDSVRGTDKQQVIYVLLYMNGAFEAYLEEEKE
jgi:hypothetical protein